MDNTRRWSLDVMELGDQIAHLSMAKAAQLSEYLETAHGIGSPAMGFRREDVIDTKDHQIQPEPTEFGVVLEGFDVGRKVALIRLVREFMGLGIKEAKDLVETSPKVITANLPKGEAEKLKSQLEAAGAKVSLRPVG